MRQHANLVAKRSGSFVIMFCLDCKIGGRPGKSFGTVAAHRLVKLLVYVPRAVRKFHGGRGVRTRTCSEMKKTGEVRSEISSDPSGY